MKKKFLCLLTSLTAFIIFSQPLSAHELFDNFYFFGDSLSDMGNGNPAYPHVSVPATNQYTWAEYFAEKFGDNATASNNGGNDYAIYGTLTSDLSTEFNEYFSDHTVDNNALYSIWSGSNDMAALTASVAVYATFYKAVHGQDPSTQQILNYALSTNSIPTAVNNITTQINALHLHGARYIIVFNLPPLGDTPLANKYANGAFDSFLNWAAQTFNQTLLTQTNNLGFSVIQVDIFSLFNDIMADPAHFGLINVTTPCDNGTTVCSNPNQYLFWNEEHPTSAGHQMVADYVESIIQGPILISALADAPFSVMDGQNSNVENEIFSLRTSTTPIPTQQVIPFISSSYTPADEDSQYTHGALVSGFDADSINANFGIAYPVNDNFLMGLSGAHSFSNIKFGRNTGSTDLNENIISAFGSYQYKKLYIDGIIDRGFINYNAITRNIPIGVSQNTAHGQTDGSQWGLDFTFGYNFLNNQLKLGPIANIDYQNVHIDAYAENGSINGIAENFDIQTNNYLTSGLGGQVSYDTQLRGIEVMPFAQLTYNYQWERGTRNVGGGLTSLPGSNFTIPVSSPFTNFALANIGVVTTPFKDVNFTLAYQTTLFATGGSIQNVSANLQVFF